MIRQVCGPLALFLGMGVMLTSYAPTPENCRLDQTATGMFLGALFGAGAGAVGAAIGGANTGTAALITAGAGIVGAAIGGEIGRRGDEACKQQARSRALELALARNAAQVPQSRSSTSSSSTPRPPATPSPVRKAPASAPQPKYEVVTWTNPGTGRSGEIQPLSAMSDPVTKEDCMIHRDSILENGTVQVVEQKFCRGADGRTRIAN